MTTQPNDTTPVAVATDAGTLLERASAKAQVETWIAAAIAEAQAEGDETGAVPEYLVELLADVDADLRTKVERTAAVYRRKGTEVAVLDAMIADAEREVARLRGRKMTREREQERIKQYVWLCLDIAGETRVETPAVTVRIQRNGGAPAIRWLLSPDELPEAFRRAPLPPALDVAAARAHLKQHDHLPDGFEVTPPGLSLRIV